MPEGPTIVILKELVSPLIGQIVLEVSGNTKIDTSRFVGQEIVAIRSWGKHFLISFPAFTLRVHFLLYGSYRFNEERIDMTPRLSLNCEDDALNLYACSLRIIEEDLNEIYEWESDVMSEIWDDKKAHAKLMKVPEMLVCDALLDQDIFAGVGNIIKNEVLFRIRIHPLSEVGALTPSKLAVLIREARNYSFDFLVWKKAYVLKKHYLIYTKSICSICGGKIKRQSLGKNNRRTFSCEHCQKLHIREKI